MANGPLPACYILLRTFLGPQSEDQLMSVPGRCTQTCTRAFPPSQKLEKGVLFNNAACMNIAICVKIC